MNINLKNIKYFVFALILLFIVFVSIQCTTQTKPTTPKATDVKILGKANVGETLTGSYTYDDNDPKNNIPEGTSIYKWKISDKEDGEYKEISGETSKKYTVKDDDVNKYIKFEVTPVSSDKKASPGTPAESKPVKILPRVDVIDDNDGFRVVYIKNQEELDKALEINQNSEKVKYKLSKGEYKIDEVFVDSKSQWIQGEDREGVVLKGNTRFNNCDTIRVTDLTLEHSGNAGEQYGIAFDNTKNSYVKNVRVKNAIENGIHCISSEVDVTDSVIENNGAANILYTKGSKGKVSNVTSNNAKTLDGLQVSDSEVIVENSTFNENAQSGVFFINSTGKITNCTATGSKKLHGVEIKKSKVDIEGGTFSNNQENGIQFGFGSTGTIKNVTAEGNKTRQGIHVQGGSSVEIINCVTIGNGQSGVYVFDKSKANIVNLKSMENRLNGVKVESSEVDIIREEAARTASTISSNHESGLSYKIGSKGTIKNCDCSSSKKLHGIEIDNSSLTIENCEFKTNNVAGVLIDGKSKVTIKNSKSEENVKDGLIITNSEANIENSSSSNNNRYGLIASKSTITLKNVTIENNKSGDIINLNESSTINIVNN